MGVFHGNLPFGRKKRPQIQDINQIIEDYGTVCLKNMEPKKTKYDQNICSCFQ